MKWWYKVCRLPDNRYPKQLLSQEWEIKPRKGRQRKTSSRTIDDIFHSLSLDKSEILDDMHEGNSSLKSSTEDDLREREAEEFRKGLDSKVKLDLYRRFGGKREFKKYLHGRSDEGARLLFKFRSGTHGLNEEGFSPLGETGEEAALPTTLSGLGSSCPRSLLNPRGWGVLWGRGFEEAFLVQTTVVECEKKNKMLRS